MTPATHAEDARVTCTRCAWYVDNRQCRRALQAGLSRREPAAYIGRTFATMLQHCSGFAERTKRTGGAA